MLKLQQYELDDIEAVLEHWLDVEAWAIDPIVRRQRFRDAVDRIYEVCQTAHARELREAAKKVEIEP